ncbi:amidase family protein [Tenacibaculum sp. 190524A02b]|uniref:amidase family protein n=1 Tax=Tenacibaculum vairaonense TaxID=3137860 RepID=UPI0031FA6FCD
MIEVVKTSEIAEIARQQEHENSRMRFKLIQSKYLDLNKEFKPFEKDLEKFTESDYIKLKPLILENNITSIQKNIEEGKLSYEKLILFYLYRIRKFEKDTTKRLNAIISLNPNILKEAKEKDRQRLLGKVDSQIYGMPILVKDNVDIITMATTAGAVVFKDNLPQKDAFIIERLKKSGALILGKVNLSEWAYFFCNDCPLGYSATGGQTLNPYGRKRFETGGSSAGSGVAVAANYAVAAIGTETSGSITSPSSLNSVVGLKPTIGFLSRSGIVPISSTLDTPGPMTKNVVDNAILLEAMIGLDVLDSTTTLINKLPNDYFNLNWSNEYLEGKKIGVLTPLLTDSIYKKSVHKIKGSKAIIVELSPDEMNYEGFLNLLTTEMKHDLPHYIKSSGNDSLKVSNVKDIVKFNSLDLVKRAPYGQDLFEGIVADTTSVKKLSEIKNKLQKEGEKYLEALITKKVDVVVSINNNHSAVAAVAKLPTLTVPMGYKETGEPISLTFIGRPLSENELLKLGYAFEQLTKVRKIPNDYQ